MSQGEPRSVPSTVLQRVGREKTGNIVGRIPTYNIRADGTVKVTTIPGEPST